MSVGANSRPCKPRKRPRLVAGAIVAMDLRVARPPQSRAEALELAREHYVYCSDSIGQGVGTLCGWAALLLGHAWWSFWWD
jgi:Domain of unknown function (DUF4253)